MNIGGIAKVKHVWRCIKLEDGVFPDKDGDVGETGVFLEVIPVVPLAQEKLRFLVMVSIPHTTRGDFDGVIEIGFHTISFLIICQRFCMKQKSTGLRYRL